MSKHAAYVPKHRQAPKRPIAQARQKAVRSTVLLSTLAVAGTGAAVAGGVAVSGPAEDAQVAHAAVDLPDASAPLDSDLLAERAVSTSRSSDRRQPTDPEKQAVLASVAGGRTSAVTESEDIADEDPRTIASAMLGEYGWDADQMSCLDSLWTKESGWRVDADNPSSSAYGIPQALPGSKMSTAGADWATNPATQIEWGLGYIEDRYGSPCSAWGHSQANNWY